MGPCFDISIKRTKYGSDDLMKLATKVPKEVQAKKVKNISRSGFGDKMGTIHMQPQDLSKLALSRMKGLKKRKRDGEEAPSEKTEEPSAKKPKRATAAAAADESE